MNKDVPETIREKLTLKVRAMAESQRCQSIYKKLEIKNRAELLSLIIIKNVISHIEIITDPAYNIAK